MYDELLVADGVSPGVSTGEVLVTLIGFTLLYGVLAVVNVYLLRKYAREGVTGEQTPDDVAKALAY